MSVRVITGDSRDVLKTLPDRSVHCCVSSPPYFGLRCYGMDAQIGLEATPEAFVAELVQVFREVRRVLRDDGTLWLNLGDSYAGGGGGNYNTTGKTRANGCQVTNVRNRPDWLDSAGLKAKDLIGVPWRVAFALQADGWYLRQDIIWAKPNPMPESVRDRCTKAHEYLFLLSKSPTYFCDMAAIAEPALDSGGNGSFAGRQGGARDAAMSGGIGTEGMLPYGGTRNKRSVWTVATQPFNGSRFLGGAADGSGRITSPDCPVHGDQRAPVATASSGGRQAASRSASNPRSDDRPDQSRLGGLFPTEMPRAEDCVRGSSDSQVQPCSPPATSHNKETRKTGLVPVTSLRERGDAESVNGTAGTAPLLETGATFGRIPASSSGQGSEPDAPPMRPSGRMESSSAGKCTCRIIDHFATFPPDLIVDCIKAGCPATCCSACGAPRVRVMESTGAANVENERIDHNGVPGLSSGTSHDRVRALDGKNYQHVRRDTGRFDPACDCDAPDKPGTVLDPFAGAGTTGLVADRLQRDAVLIELNPAYAAMSRARLVDDAPLFAEVA